VKYRSRNNTNPTRFEGNLALLTGIRKMPVDEYQAQTGRLEMLTKNMNAPIKIARYQARPRSGPSHGPRSEPGMGDELNAPDELGFWAKVPDHGEPCPERAAINGPACIPAVNAQATIQVYVRSEIRKRTSRA